MHHLQTRRWIGLTLASFSTSLDAAGIKRKDKGINTFTEFFNIIKIVYLGIFIPVILVFIYHVVKDPAFPKLMVALWKSIQNNATAYLSFESTKKDHVSKSHHTAKVYDRKTRRKQAHAQQYI